MAVRLNATVKAVTERIAERSRDRRAAYLEQMRAARRDGPHRAALSCGNLAHGYAGCPRDEKEALAETGARAAANVAIVTAYNDMLSAHRPFKDFPDEIKTALREAGAVGEVAGATPAMCDGVTQGQPGMDLSLFSRDVIALSTAIALSHNMFDAALCLGVCDKIVPGLMIGALRFGHLPTIFVPGGPMPSGIPNDEKARIRQLFAEGKVGREKLLAAESASYHSPGTCTFYGTANTNQMLMEIMGLHLPGAAFPNPGTPLRRTLTRAAAGRAAAVTALGDDYAPLSGIVDERAVVNAVVALNATGGSTNHAIHLVAMARAAGIVLTWEDMDALSGATPLLARVYPNGAADVNHFHAAGGVGFIIRELIDSGLAHADVNTVMGTGLSRYAQEPFLDGDRLAWRPAPENSGDTSVLRPAADPFAASGGLRLVTGPLGRAIVKVSAVRPEHRIVEAPAAVFESQQAFLDSFRAGALNRDVVAVLRWQGPRANGMPELHKLTPPLGVLQDKGFRVALVTDGRMSGASGKVPAAIHVSPEAAAGGAIAKIRDGDIIRLDAERGVLDIRVDPAAFAARDAAPARQDRERGHGRELFSVFRAAATPADEGALSIPFTEHGAI